MPILWCKVPRSMLVADPLLPCLSISKKRGVYAKYEIFGLDDKTLLDPEKPRL